MIYVISYDLNHPGQNYENLYKAIQSLGPCIHPLQSTWLVSTPNTVLGNTDAEKILEKIKPIVDKDDVVFVNKVTSDCAFSLEEKDIKWIKEHINTQ